MVSAANVRNVFGEMVSLERGGKTYKLSKERVVVGRENACDIVLPFNDVSHKHCELIYQNGTLFIKDLKSKNGVKLNGARMQTTLHRLDTGDVIGLGQHRFHVEYIKDSDSKH